MNKTYIVSPVLQNFPLYFKTWTTFISIEKIKLTTGCTVQNCHFTSRLHSQLTLIPQIWFQFQSDIQFAVGPQNTHFQSTPHIFHGLLIFQSPICPTYLVHTDCCHSHCGLCISDRHQHIRWGRDHTGNLPQCRNTSHL